MDMKYYHCPSCRRLLFKGTQLGGTIIEIKCPSSKCKKMITFSGNSEYDGENGGGGLTIAVKSV